MSRARRPCLADDAVAEDFGRHVGDGAGGLGLHAADQVQVARQAKVRDLGAEAVWVAGAGRQQHVACKGTSPETAGSPLEGTPLGALHLNACGEYDGAGHGGRMCEHQDFKAALPH